MSTSNNKPRAVFKDDTVRCSVCGVEIWEDVDCDCGVDGADHEGLVEAYTEKRNAAQHSDAVAVDDDIWTEEDERVFRPLLRKYMRLRKRSLRGEGRVKKYGARTTRKDDTDLQDTSKAKDYNDDE